MMKPKLLKPGDNIAIVSLSSGKLGEEFCSHNIEIGSKRMEEFGLTPVFMANSRKGIKFLKEHPEKRAEDLKQAFLDDSIHGIICAIGGDDTYRLLPYLMEDQEFLQAVLKSPKLFLGFSDTTVNHLMFYRIGLQTFYGQSFISELAEIAEEMLPYSREAFLGCFHGFTSIKPSELWYEERKDFSRAAIGINRVSHKESHGYELLCGSPIVEGELLGGCLESLYDMLSSTRYAEESEICKKYRIFPEQAEWEGKIMFLETCEEKPEPELLYQELKTVEKTGAFEVINGIIVGKPQDEQYYEEYKEVYQEMFGGKNISVLYNLNFGHALPRAILPYGAKVRVDAKRQDVKFL
ncbi:MAG: LD-carboxypeptidase [Lachnospiraceae bacterium]|nr:LD-carboxypeptidase [Lachnospiraceae bacterium]